MQPIVCEKIVNGTVVSEEEDENKESKEEEEKELDQLTNQQMQLNRFDSQQNNRYRVSHNCLTDFGSLEYQQKLSMGLET